MKSLSDPEEYPNWFEDWQVALAVESKAGETRSAFRMHNFLNVCRCFDSLCLCSVCKTSEDMFTNSLTLIVYMLEL